MCKCIALIVFEPCIPRIPCSLLKACMHPYAQVTEWNIHLRMAVDIRPAARQQLFLLFVRNFLFRYVSRHLPLFSVVICCHSRSLLFMWALLSQRYIFVFKAHLQQGILKR